MARATENSEASVKAKRGGAVGEGEGEGTGMRRQKEKGPRAMLPSRRRARPAGRLASYKARKEGKRRYYCRGCPVGVWVASNVSAVKVM